MTSENLKRWYTQEFSPWKHEGSSRIVPAEAGWGEPVKWNRVASDFQAIVKANHDRAEKIKQQVKIDLNHEALLPIMQRPMNAAIHASRLDEAKQLRESTFSAPRVFPSVCDPFQNDDGRMVNSQGMPLKVAGGGWLPYVGNTQSRRPLTLDDVRRRFFALIDSTPNLWWLLRTSQPENIRKCWLPSHGQSVPDGYELLTAHRSNVFLGVPVSTQQQADQRIPELLKCSDLAAGLFVFVEPTETIDLKLLCEFCLHDPDSAERPPKDDHPLCGHGSQCPYISWVIASGSDSEPTNVQHQRQLRDQCQAAEVPFFLERLGAHPRPSHLPSDVKVRFIKHPTGSDPEEWPEDLRVRQLPAELGAV